MNWLNNLKVVQKLALLILVLIAGLICVGGTGYFFLGKANEVTDKMYNEKLMEVELISESRIHARRIDRNIMELMLAKDGKESQALLDEINKRVKLFDENITKFEQMPISDKDKAEVKELRDSLGKYREARTKVIELATQNKDTEAYALYKQQVQSLVEDFNIHLTKLTEETKKSAEAMNQENKKGIAAANMIFITIIIIAIVLGALLGWLISKRITRRLSDVVVFLEYCSKGDFSKAVSQENLQDKSEFGIVSRAVDVMNKNIRTLIKQLANTSEQLAASSEELTASAEQSAQASNQVAGSVTEVAQGSEKQLHIASNANEVVQQISKAIHQVAGNTTVVSNSAEKAATTANDGEQAIKQAVSQMKIIEQKTNDTAQVISELEEKSKQIGQIVEAISSISGQTNLLALNAAIEAARAGEAGRGFAVVAEEVRKLAEQSQEAAKQITNLINEVQAKTDSAVAFMRDGKQEVDAGTKVVENAGQSFDEILIMVREMNNQIHEISAAVQEVTSGTQNVVHSVQDIERESRNAAEQTQTISAATEEQSASIEEIASSSQHLAKMAEDLQVAINKFKV
ncbi:MAG: chemotaxis protein [Firmicutes bacterium]|nr:chemotaxis protein [Bacillota bacterium]